MPKSVFIFINHQPTQAGVIVVPCTVWVTPMVVDVKFVGKAATGWSVFVSGVDLGRSRVLSGPPDCR